MYSHVTRTSYGADAIAYARGDGGGHNGAKTRNDYVAGVNMLPDSVVQFEAQMQVFWNKADPRHKIQIDRFIVSFSTDELDPDNPEDLVKALDIGCRIARENAPDSQSAVYVQTDGVGHKVHLHILTNDVTMTDHKGLDSKAYFHFHFRQIVDKICEEYFDLKKAELLPERVNPAVRGARIKNEQIKAENALEIKRASAAGRSADIKPLKYIWQDDLRERIKNAAMGAADEASFAHRLRLNGVELVPHKAKDGMFSYLHPATKKQPAHYTYELIDVSGFNGKIPPNLRSKSFKLGADYQPEGVVRLFQQQAQAAPTPVHIQPLPAVPQKPIPVPKAVTERPKQLSPEEKRKAQEQADVKQALDAAKRCVAPIVHQYIPDADEETENRLFNRFVSWHKAKRDKAKEEGKQVPPIFIKDQHGKRLTIFERLKEQFLEFIIMILEDEAEKKRQRLRQQQKALSAEVRRTAGYVAERQRSQTEGLDYTGR